MKQEDFFMWGVVRVLMNLAIAGVATVTAALYYGIRGTYRFLTQPEKIAALQLFLTAHQEALNAA